MVLVGGVALARVAVVGGRRQQALLIQQREHARRPLGLDEVEDVLVVGEVDVAPVDALALVLGLLELEDEVVDVGFGNADVRAALAVDPAEAIQ